MPADLYGRIAAELDRATDMRDRYKAALASCEAVLAATNQRIADALAWSEQNQRLSELDRAELRQALQAAGSGRAAERVEGAIKLGANPAVRATQNSAETPADHIAIFDGPPAEVFRCVDDSCDNPTEHELGDENCRGCK